MATEKKAIAIEDVANALNVMRETLEKKQLSDSETAVTVKKCETALDQFSEFQSKYTADKEAHTKHNKEVEDQYISIEKQLTRMSASSDEYSTGKAELKAFMKLLRYGKTWMLTPLGDVKKENLFNNAEFKLLRTDDNAQGGFLAPDDFIALILKKIVEVSPVRRVARQISVSAGAIQIPKRETLVEVAYTGEAQAKLPDNSTYGIETINLNTIVAVSRITRQLVNDAKFNMEQQMQLDVADGFAQKEGQKFVNGNGVIEPEGFMFNTAITSINSGVANDIEGDNLIDLTGALPSGQNPIFAMNRRTIAAVRKLKDSSGAYLFHLDSGLQTGIGATIAGFSFIEMIDMADIAVDSFPIIFGDFNRGYLIIDGAAMNLVRDDTTQAEKNIIRFVWSRFNGGQVVLADAFIKLKVAA